VSEIDRHEEAVKTAYEAGLSNGREQGVQIGIEMGMKRATEIMSRDLHNFKFPEGQIPIDMPLTQHAPKDNSTFEFSYQTYEERVKEREAAQRNVRRRRSNRMVAKNRKRRETTEDHGYDELLAEEGIFIKE
jgi:hypothetical protein